MKSAPAPLPRHPKKCDHCDSTNDVKFSMYHGWICPECFKKGNLPKLVMPNDNDKELCNHKYIFIETIKRRTGHQSYLSTYIKTDRFFCEKCLKQKETIKETHSRNIPDWW